MFILHFNKNMGVDMFEYKIRKASGEVDCGGDYGFKNKKDAIAAFKTKYENWQEWHCTIYAPGYRGCAVKRNGNVNFRSI